MKRDRSGSSRDFFRSAWLPAAKDFFEVHWVPISCFAVVVLVLWLMVAAESDQQVKVSGVSGRVERVRFAADSVTCYIYDGYNAGGIACLRDEGRAR